MPTGDDLRALRRRALLVTAGEQAARVMTRVVALRHGPGDPIVFNSNASCIDDAIKSYFSRMVSFKNQNDFRDGDLINYSKISGLFSLVILDKKSDPFFIIPKRLENSAYHRLMIPMFVYVLMGSVLSLDLSKVNAEVESDLIRCLTLHPDIRADADWLFWSFKVLQIAYGNPALSAPDPAG